MRLNRGRNKIIWAVRILQLLQSSRIWLLDGFEVSFNVGFPGQGLIVSLSPAAEHQPIFRECLMPSASERGEGFERTAAKSRDFHFPGGLGAVGVGNGSVQASEGEGNVPGRLPQSRVLPTPPNPELCSLSAQLHRSLFLRNTRPVPRLG